MIILTTCSKLNRANLLTLIKFYHNVLQASCDLGSRYEGYVRAETIGNELQRFAADRVEEGWRQLRHRNGQVGTSKQIRIGERGLRTLAYLCTKQAEVKIQSPRCVFIMRTYATRIGFNSSQMLPDDLRRVIGLDQHGGVKKISLGGGTNGGILINRRSGDQLPKLTQPPRSEKEVLLGFDV